MVLLQSPITSSRLAYTFSSAPISDARIADYGCIYYFGAGEKPFKAELAPVF